MVAARGELSEDEVLAVVAPVPGQSIDPVELTRFLVDRLPYFMVPRYVRVVAGAAQDADPEDPEGRASGARASPRTAGTARRPDGRHQARAAAMRRAEAPAPLSLHIPHQPIESRGGTHERARGTRASKFAVTTGWAAANSSAGRWRPERGSSAGPLGSRPAGRGRRPVQARLGAADDGALGELVRAALRGRAHRGGGDQRRRRHHGPAHRARRGGRRGLGGQAARGDQEAPGAGLSATSSARRAARRPSPRSR